MVELRNSPDRPSPRPSPPSTGARGKRPSEYRSLHFSENSFAPPREISSVDFAMWTKSQKISGAVLGLAAVAFCVDRFALGGGGDKAAAAAADEYAVDRS